MSDGIEYREVEEIAVWMDGTETLWSLERTARHGSQWTLVLTAPDGVTWTASAQGLWNALVALRRQTDRLGYKLCCAGARVDALMRKGRDWNNDIVYILSRRTLLGIHHRAMLFDYAPATTIGTVEEQDARYHRWLATPWWRALLPGDPVR
ncbi:hypothetical protein [Kribbella swartbergensis]